MLNMYRLKGRLLYRVMSLSCSLSFALYGYDAGVLGGVQATEPFLSALGNPTGKWVVPMVASSYVLAATVLSFGVMFFGMGLGRRMCIMLGNCCVIIGAILQATAMGVPHIIVGRCMSGFGIGFISSTVPTYMAEMSIEHKERGPEVAVQCSWLIFGIAIAYWIDFAFTRLNTQISWRFPIAFQAVFAILSLVAMLGLPDTPRWYYAKGRMEEGDSVLSRLHDLPLEHTNVQQQRMEILNSIALEEHEENKLSLMSLFWDNTELRVGRRIRISFLILSIQQMMGINMLVYYSTRIFTEIGYSDFLSQLLAAIMNTGFAIGTLPTIWTIERFGRRKIMLWSAAVCGASLILFMIMIGLPNPSLAKQWTSVGAIMMYMFAFGYGWVGCPWLYGPEIAPLKYRHIGGAAGSTGEWLFSFITVFAGGIAIQTVGWRIWIWQLVACISIMFFVYYMCPETSGKSLEEIDGLFARPSARDAHWVAENGSDSKDSIENVSLQEIVAEK